MKITILTIAPELFSAWLSEKKRREETLNLRDQKPVTVEVIDIRDYVHGSFRAVDDSPYGGGAGMVIRCEPVTGALKALKAWPEKGKDIKIAALTPTGRQFSQKEAEKLANEVEHLILLCGHFEGLDERIYTYCDERYSIGDYVLSGGELPAMVIAEAITSLW